MKKLFPLAFTTCLLAACACGSSDNWGMCEDPTCCNPREPLSERSWGSNRGYHNVPLQYNDQDYKGKKHCARHMKHEHKEGGKKGMKKHHHGNAAGEPVAGKQPPQPERRRGLFF